MKILKRYQYIPPTVPESWQGEPRRFALRLLEVIGDLYLRLGRLPARCYPKGSVYMTTDEGNPGRLLGGEWRHLITESPYHLWERIG